MQGSAVREAREGISLGLGADPYSEGVGAASVQLWERETPSDEWAPLSPRLADDEPAVGVGEVHAEGELEETLDEWDQGEDVFAAPITMRQVRGDRGFRDADR